MEKTNEFSDSYLLAKGLVIHEQRKLLMKEPDWIVYRIVDRIAKYFNERKSRQ